MSRHAGRCSDDGPCISANFFDIVAFGQHQREKISHQKQIFTSKLLCPPIDCCLTVARWRLAHNVFFIGFLAAKD
jgi:hypothetical protein